MAEEAVQEQNEATSWYEIGFSRGLTEPNLMLGVPTTALVYNGLLALFFLMEFHFWQIIPVSIVLHFLMVYVCKSDSRFFDCLLTYIHKKNYYCT